jgi:hypothetical protein
MKAKPAVLCVLILSTVMTPAPAQESATKVTITSVTASGVPHGNAFSIACEGSRCHGPYWLDVSGMSYRFEALVFFAPGSATIALEPVANAAGQMIFLDEDTHDPIVLATDRDGTASRTVNLTEVTERKTRSIVKHPVLRLGTVGQIRIDVVGPRPE